MRYSDYLRLRDAGVALENVSAREFADNFAHQVHSKWSALHGHDGPGKGLGEICFFLGLRPGTPSGQRQGLRFYDRTIQPGAALAAARWDKPGARPRTPEK